MSKVYVCKRTDGRYQAEYNSGMKRNEDLKKENDREEKWYARMNAIEAVWQNMMEESRLECLDKTIQIPERCPKTEFPRK